MITCACFVMCECVSSESMYKVTEHKCEILWYIFCQINIKIVFDVAIIKVWKPWSEIHFVCPIDHWYFSLYFECLH